MLSRIATLILHIHPSNRIKAVYLGLRPFTDLCRTPVVMLRLAAFIVLTATLMTSVNGQTFTRSFDPGTGDYLKALGAKIIAEPTNQRQRDAYEPFAVAFFGWNLIAMSRLKYNSLDAASMEVAQVGLSIFTNELNDVVATMAKRPTTLQTFVDATDQERAAIRKVIVQKYAMKYSAMGAIVNDEAELDEIANWKYALGASLGELAGYISQWYAYPTLPGYQEAVARNLSAMQKHLNNAPPGVTPEFRANMQKLVAFAANKSFTVDQRSALAAALKETLLSTINFGTLVSANTAPRTTTALATTTTATTDPAAAKGHFDRATKLFDSNDIPGALTAFNAAIRLDPENGLYYFRRAYLYGRLNDANAQINDYTRAIRYKGNLRESHYNRGSVYLSEKLYPSAIGDFTSALAIDPSFYQAHYNRALAYFHSGNLKAAEADLNRAISINPEHGRSYFLRADIYCSQGLIMSAIKDEDAAIKLGENVVKRCGK